MAGMQVAQFVVAIDASQFFAAMTSAFAVGQLIGPLEVSETAAKYNSTLVPSVGDTTLLIPRSIALLVCLSDFPKSVVMGSRPADQYTFHRRDP